MNKTSKNHVLILSMSALVPRSTNGRRMASLILFANPWWISPMSWSPRTSWLLLSTRVGRLPLIDMPGIYPLMSFPTSKWPIIPSRAQLLYNLIIAPSLTSSQWLTQLIQKYNIVIASHEWFRGFVCGHMLTTTFLLNPSGSTIYHLHWLKFWIYNIST